MELKQLLMKEQERLEKIINICDQRLKDAPPGVLRVTKTKEFTQFYHSIRKDGVRKYITKENHELAEKLAQKEYDERVLKLAQKRLTQINRLLKDYQDDEIEKYTTGSILRNRK